MSRKPVVIPKSARSIPQQVINEESGPDGDVSSYCPHSGPYGFRHRHHPTAVAEERRPSFRRLPRRNPKRSAERREHLRAGRRAGLLGAKAVPSMSLLAPTSTHCPGILPPRARCRWKYSKRAGKATEVTRSRSAHTPTPCRRGLAAERGTSREHIRAKFASPVRVPHTPACRGSSLFLSLAMGLATILTTIGVCPPKYAHVQNPYL